MNFLDIILLVLLGLFFILGFRKGLIIGLATLAALVLGVWAGFHFSEWVSGLIERGFDYHGKYAGIISFILIIIAVIVLTHLLARVLTRAVKPTALGVLNKIGGGLLGLLKAAFALSLLIYFLNRFDESHSLIADETRQNSLLFPTVESIAPLLMPKMKAYAGVIPGWEKPAESRENTDSVP